MITRNEEEIRAKALSLIREKFHKCYVEKKCERTGSIDHILSDFLSLEFADKVIEMVFERMCRMKFSVDEYRPIVTVQSWHDQAAFLPKSNSSAFPLSNSDIAV